jgi:hypothetical protein
MGLDASAILTRVAAFTLTALLIVSVILLVLFG